MSLLPPPQNVTPLSPVSARPRSIHCVPGGFHWSANVIIGQIIKSCESSSSCVVIYYALCQLSSEEGNKSAFRASYGAIAGRCGLSKSTVERNIDDLARNGFIVIEPGPKNSRIPNRYTLLHEKLAPNEDR